MDLEEKTNKKEGGSGGISVDELAFVIVLGAQLVPRLSATPTPTTATELSAAASTGISTSSNEGRPVLVPSFHLEMRVAAAAALLSHGQRRPLRFVLSGGYNVGVRYVVGDGPQSSSSSSSSSSGLSGLLDPPCFTFEALAGAQQGYPSEAAVMKDRLCQHYAVREGTEAIFVLEEASSTTLENAAMCKMLLARLTLHLPQPGGHSPPSPPSPPLSFLWGARRGRPTFGSSRSFLSLPDHFLFFKLLLLTI
jgi:hypothetical protein